MRLTFACLLFIVICMTVSARYPYGYGANNKDKKSWFRAVARWTRSAFGAAKRWTRTAFETAIRSDRWEKKRGSWLFTYFVYIIFSETWVSVFQSCFHTVILETFFRCKIKKNGVCSNFYPHVLYIEICFSWTLYSKLWKVIYSKLWKESDVQLHQFGSCNVEVIIPQLGPCTFMKTYCLVILTGGFN